MADFRFTVSPEEDGLEARVLMRRHFDFSSRLRGRIKREKRLLRNGQPVEGWHRLSAGDVISVDLPRESSHFTPEDIPLEAVYEDEDLLVLNKQAGIVVHPTNGHNLGTVANGLMYRMQQRGESYKIRFINRLDMDTSGLLVVAKNAYAQTDYVRQTERGRVKKTYTALVHGLLEEDQGLIDLPIAPPLAGDVRRRVSPEGAPSRTRYSVIRRFPAADFTLLRLVLETGRTHQIRVHLSHLGHPIAGDPLYGPAEESCVSGSSGDESSPASIRPEEKAPLIGRQALHASSLAFPHPTTKKELRLEAPLPDDFRLAIRRLESVDQVPGT